MSDINKKQNIPNSICNVNQIKQTQKDETKTSKSQPLSREENRKKNMMDIYIFFCKLLYRHGSCNDFDKMSYDTSVLTIGKLMILCRQFGILDSKIKTNNQSEYLKEIEKTTLDVLSKKEKSPDKSGERVQVNQGHKWWQGEKYQDQRYQYFENLQKEQLKGYKKLTREELGNIFKLQSNNMKEINFQQYQKLIYELAQKMFEALNRSRDQCYELFLTQILKIDNQEYKKYLQVLNTAFYCYEKNGFRQLPGNEQKEYKDLNETNKKAIQQWHQLKANKIHYENMNQEKSSLYRNMASVESRGLSKQDSNYQISTQIIKKQDPNSKGLTWEKLDKLNYADILLQKDFKPQDLLDDDLDTDDVFYLREFSLEKDSGKQIANNHKTESLQHYGSISALEHKLQLITIPVYPNQLPVYPNQALSKQDIHSVRTKRQITSVQYNPDRYSSNKSLASNKSLQNYQQKQFLGYLQKDVNQNNSSIQQRDNFGMVPQRKNLQAEHSRRLQELFQEEVKSKIYFNGQFANLIIPRQIK